MLTTDDVRGAFDPKARAKRGRASMPESRKERLRQSSLRWWRSVEALAEELDLNPCLVSRAWSRLKHFGLHLPDRLRSHEDDSIYVRAYAAHRRRLALAACDTYATGWLARD